MPRERLRELKDVLAVLSDQGNVRIAASVEGLPGVGKTELALQVCGLCERERAYRIFWFDAENPDLAASWADVVAPHLGIEAAKPEQRTKLAIQALEALGEPVLLVLDNVEEWSHSRPWPRPRGRHIRWLITTRSSGLGGREFRHIEVPVLDHASAEALMARIAGPEIAQRPGFHALMDALGGYTISVELAATFLQRFPEVPPHEYLEPLQQGRAAELEEEVEARTLSGATLERALELLWARLPARARRSWQLAACFADAPASAELSDACGLGRKERAELRDYHLIQTHSAKGWSMHRLVRAFGRRAGSDAERDAEIRAFLQGNVTRAEEMNVNRGFQVYGPDRDHFEGVQMENQRKADGFPK